MGGRRSGAFRGTASLFMTTGAPRDEAWGRKEGGARYVAAAYQVTSPQIGSVCSRFLGEVAVQPYTSPR